MEHDDEPSPTLPECDAALIAPTSLRKAIPYAQVFTGSSSINEIRRMRYICLVLSPAFAVLEVYEIHRIGGLIPKHIPFFWALLMLAWGGVFWWIEQVDKDLAKRETPSRSRD